MAAIEIVRKQTRVVEIVREGPQGPAGPQGEQGPSGSAGDHDHVIADVTGLQAALDAKADDSHSHAQSDITGLAAALALKLDSASYTAADVLTKIKTVDGVASGLDADTLDGLDSGAFALSGHNHSSTYQPLDPTLTALAGVTVSADKIIYATGADAFATTDLSSFARTLLDDANQGAARSTLGLGTAATSATGDFAAASHGHAASEITSGLLATARIASGTASDGYVPVADGSGNVVWEAQSGSGGGSVAWDDVTDKPTEFPPEDHDHAQSEITGLTAALAAKLDASSYTAADVLAKLLTVDGSGSGIDADLLDGNSAAAFATSGHNHDSTYVALTGNQTVAGEKTFSDNATFSGEMDVAGPAAFGGTVSVTGVLSAVSPAFTGNPTAPTQTAGNNSTRIATTAYVDAAVAAGGGGGGDVVDGITTETANYTLALGDANNVVRMNVATANTVTVPPNSSVAFPTNTVLWVEQEGAGRTQLVADTGVTFKAPVTPVYIGRRYGRAMLVKIASDTWAIDGRITDLEVSGSAPDDTAGSTYTGFTSTVSGGFGTATTAVTAGAVPTGTSYNGATHTISTATVTNDGTFTPTITATDSAGNQASHTDSILISPDPSVSARYWRIRPTANNGGPEYAIGEVQMYAVSGGSNLATVGANASASTEINGSNSASHCIGSVAGAGWISSNTAGTQWWKYDFGSTQTITEIKLYIADNVFGAGGASQIKDFVIETSDDNSAWTTRKTVTNQTGWTVSTAKTYTVP